MDYRSNEEFQRGPAGRPPMQPNPAAGMLTAAWLLVFGAFATTGMIWICLVLASLAITLSLLSRGQSDKMDQRGRIIVSLAVIAMVASVVITAIHVMNIINEYGSIQNFVEYFVENYGYMLEEYGISAESLQMQ